MARRRSREEVEIKGGESGLGRWLLTYADLITLLMLFFIVMYAMSVVDQKKFEALSESLVAGFHLGQVPIPLEQAGALREAGAGRVIVAEGRSISTAKYRASHNSTRACFEATGMAEAVAADYFMVLTDVPRVKLGFGTPEEREVDRLKVTEARRYLREGHFLEGSMAPKVLACIRFIEYGGEEAIITSLDRAWPAMQNQEGTHFVP